MNWRDEYGYAYSRAHNRKGIRNHHQLNMIAHAWADLREQSNNIGSPVYQPVVWDFETFWAAWDGGLIEPTSADVWTWVVKYGPVHHYEYYDEETELHDVYRVARREVAA